jgi:hypothetical protein
MVSLYNQGNAWECGKCTLEIIIPESGRAHSSIKGPVYCIFAVSQNNTLSGYTCFKTQGHIYKTHTLNRILNLRKNKNVKKSEVNY